MYITSPNFSQLIKEIKNWSFLDYAPPDKT